MAYKRTGRPVGRPKKEEAAERRRLAKERAREANPLGRLPKLGPETPRGLGWGGSRPGSGRPKREGPAPSEMAYFRLDRELATKLEALPEGARSEYLRRAVELMVTISPPEKFKIIQDSLEEIPSEVLPEGDMKATS